MEDILAIVLIFGGGAATLLAYSPIGKAFAARIRGETPQNFAALQGTDPAVLEELDRVRQELDQLHERLDFTERLLAGKAPASIEQEGRST